MPRVVGIDPGTVSVDVCGLDDGRVFLDRSLPTSEALAHPSVLIELLDDAHRTAPLDLVAGPSGYGLPLTAARDLTEADLRLAYLAADGESGGIGGLRVAHADARALLDAGRAHAGRRAPAVGAGAPEGEPRRHGHRGQGVRRRARRARTGRAARVRRAGRVVHPARDGRRVHGGDRRSGRQHRRWGRGHVRTARRARRGRARRRSRVSCRLGHEASPVRRRCRHDRRRGRRVSRGAGGSEHAARPPGLGGVRRERGESSGGTRGVGAARARGDHLRTAGVAFLAYATSWRDGSPA